MIITLGMQDTHALDWINEIVTATRRLLVLDVPISWKGCHSPASFP